MLIVSPNMSIKPASVQRNAIVAVCIRTH